MTQEKVGPIRQGVMWLRKLILPSSGLTIGEVNLYSKRDVNGNTDLYLARQDGTDVNLTGEVLFCRATSSLTLSTSFTSIAGDGDTGKLRLLLPTIGEWLVATVCDFERGASDPGYMTACLFVDDSGTEKDGNATCEFETNTERTTAPQQWKITTTAANTPVEIKAKMQTGGGNGVLASEHTCLSATIGAGGGSTVETVDHGTLTGRGDDDHTQYVLHSLAAAANDFLVASGNDAFVKKTLAETGAILEGDIDHGNLQGLDTGADHSYIDQDVTSGSSPTFAQAITDNAVVTIDGTANDTEHAVFNAAGLEGLTDTELIDGLSGDASGAFSWNGQALTSVGAVGCGAITSTAGIISGANIESDADDTDDLGTTSKRWGNLHLGHDVKLDSTPDADHETSGITAPFTANENHAFGDVCYLDSDGEMKLGDADAIASSYIVGMCADATISANNPGDYLLMGIARDETWTWSDEGKPVFLTITGTTGNTLSESAPTGTDDCVVIVGVTTNAKRMLFNPSPQAIVEHTG